MEKCTKPEILSCFFLFPQEHLIEFFTVLVLCHTVRVDHKTSGDTVVNTDSIYSHSGKDYEYNASSPDEKALVEACRKCVDMSVRLCVCAHV